PKSEEHVIRTRLAQAFRYIVSQRLLPRADGNGRVAAVEILKGTPRSREYIEQGESEGKTLLEAMNDGELEGMQHFDQTIERMIRSEVITQETGLAFATNPSNLLLRLSGLGTSDDMLSRREERNYMPGRMADAARQRLIERVDSLKG
ncbi:MAG TPA: type IV pili twitching motility protein PilT, partial [Blastocatellia bacterium]|nr:type IV pili twitching motility protein PilT [Blastocatellia bacterium]